MSRDASTVRHMAINGAVGPPRGRLPRSTGTVDVHAHAMPLPLLQRLADRGLADLGGVPDGIVRLDPRVSGVGPLAPLPLARSQYDVDVRLAEMDEVGVERHAVSLPPFLFCSTADDEAFATGIVGAGNDELAVYVADDPDRLVALGSVPLGWRGAAEEARRCLDELGMAGIAIGSRGGGRDLDDPVNDDLWALLSERRHVRVPAPQRGARPAPAVRLLAPPARRLPDGDRAGRRPPRLRPGAGAPPAEPVPRARRRLPARAARAAGHGLGAQGRRPHHHRAAVGVHRPALLRHRRLLQRAPASPGRGRRALATCCWAPTTPSSSATGPRSTPCVPSGSTPTPLERSSAATPRACWGLSVEPSVSRGRAGAG